MHREMHHLSPKKLLIIFTTLISIYNLSFFLIPVTLKWLFLAYSVPFILTIPGIIIFYILGLKKLNLKSLLLSNALSILALMFVGLLCNFIGVTFHNYRPLTNGWIIVYTNLFFIIGLFTIFLRRKKLNHLNVEFVKHTWIDRIFIFFSIVVIAFSICGPFRLNNGASNILSLACLFLCVALISVTILLNNRLKDSTIALTIYSCALAVLFLVSLRSWYITGHDIKQEFFVYDLTNYYQRWNMNNFRDAYNACLSITILPNMLSKLLHIEGTAVFKYINQIIFATSPLYVLLILKKYFERTMAIIGSFIFISFPTFTTDSAMLNRQEIAFIFFGALLMIWLTNIKSISVTRRTLLFLLMSFGLIVSHYSSTYLYIMIMLLAYIIIKIITYKKRDNLKHSPAFLKGSIVVIILASAFVWHSQITSVSSGLTGTVLGSIKSIPSIFAQDNRDATTNNILIGVYINQSRQLYKYIEKTKKNTSTEISTDYNSLRIVSDALTPSELFNKLKINTSRIVGRMYYSILPRVYQILVLIGVIAMSIALFRNKVQKISMELLVISLASLIVVGLQVVLPNLSLSYGLLRAFQQCLFILLVPILIALSRLSILLGIKKISVIGFSFMMINFTVYTGLMPQFTGGIPATLSLNNSGPYYGAYYGHKSDRLLQEWTKNSMAPQRDSYSQTTILPFQITDSAPIKVSYEQNKNGTNYITVSGKLLPIIYDDSINELRNNTYTNTGSKYYESKR